jgi:Uma2 family endonuclease
MREPFFFTLEVTRPRCLEGVGSLGLRLMRFDPTGRGEGAIMSERMSTIDSPRTLVEGQRLDQPTFHALYEAMPPGTRAELINGVVLMSSPVGPAHGRAQVPTLVWLSYYQENTPGVESLDTTSTALGLKSEPQPDALLCILSEYGGQTRTDRRFVQGVPELLVEVAHTSRYADLGPKFEDYERVGVLEYVVRAIEPDEVLWFLLRKGRFTDLSPGPDGIYRSEVFPGLWLDPEALVRGDARRLRAVLDLGCATPEHAAFVARLAAARKTP